MSDLHCNFKKIFFESVKNVSSRFMDIEREKKNQAAIDKTTQTEEKDHLKPIRQKAKNNLKEGEKVTTKI